MKNRLLGIDIGTSACKIAVFALDGKALAQVSHAYPVYYPAPGCVEQEPEDWWSSVCAGIRELIQAGRLDPSEIAGIGISGQSWSAIPVDIHGRVLHRTPIWLDTRSRDICLKIKNRIGADRIFALSGNAFTPNFTTPKILWFKENRPEIYKNTDRFLQSNSYIAFKLTGQMTQDLSQGYGLHVFDIRNGCWDDAFCDEMGIDRAKLPDIFPCHELIGEVTRKAAEETGLCVGTPVTAGGLDACCGALGAGVLGPGQTQEQGGQAGGMSICSDQVFAHPRLILGYHVVPDRWMLQGGTTGGGGTLKWFLRELGGFEVHQEQETGISAFKLMDEEAAAIRPGADGVVYLPYMAGERSPIWDPNAKGVFFGLDYSKSRAHMIRAVLEGCAFALLHNLRTAEETGIRTNQMNAMGGAANSRLWTQIKADVTGRRIVVPSSDTATSLGAAMLAGVGTRLYKDFSEAAARTVTITRIHEPDPSLFGQYQACYEIYLEIYERLKDTMKKAASNQEVQK